MIMNSLSIIVRYSKVFCERQLSDYGVGFPEQVILMYLSEKKYVNQDAIAHHFMLDKGAIAKTLKKLEEKELIRREQNPENKRENLISLAPGGQDILGVMRNALSEWNESFFEGISEEDEREYERITEKIAGNVARLIENQNAKIIKNEG